MFVALENEIRRNKVWLAMKHEGMRLGLYRSLFWANQGLLNAVSVLQEAEASEKGPSSHLLNQQLRRTQGMIEEARLAMNQILGEWVILKE